MASRIIPFLILLFQYHQLVSSIPANGTNTTAATHLCSPKNSLLLFRFRQSFQINVAASDYCEHAGQPSYPKTLSWNRSVDCCSWDGVTCDRLSGEVVGIDLSCSQLKGRINSNSSLFQLSHLQRLNLAHNDFMSSTINQNFTSYPRLTHLNLSFSDFSGSLPPEFSRMYGLISLDLTPFPGNISIDPHTFKLLLQNLTKLKQVSLQGCIISSTLPHNLSTSLEVLYLGSTGLFGGFPASRLERLTVLDLSENSLEGQLPNILTNFKSLTTLDLCSNFFSGHFPSSILNLTKLERLDLAQNSIEGPLPSHILGGVLPNLSTLVLSNNSINGTIPSWVFNLPSLIKLAMRDNQLTGQLHEFQCVSLQRINLRNNKLNGNIPASISKLLNLTDLVLSNNNFSGTVEVSLFTCLHQLVCLDLSHNNISFISNNRGNSTLPPSLRSLYLSSCGVKDLDFLHGLNNLLDLDLSSNMLEGGIFSSSLTWAQGLSYLNLSHNSLTCIGQLPSESLSILDLSSNFLSGPLLMPSATVAYYFASNNEFIGEIPSSICRFSSLRVLDLSNNNLSGDIPQCLGNATTSLWILDLHSNNFRGRIPSSFSIGCKLEILNVDDNQLEGGVPRSLSNCLDLKLIDVGKNNLKGIFPWWLGGLPRLQVLILRVNHFNGSMRLSETGSSFRELRILDICHNQFSGTLSARFFIQFGGMKIVNHAKMKYLSGSDVYYKSCVSVITKGVEMDVVNVLSIFSTMDISGNKFQGVLPDAIGDLRSLQAMNFSHNQFGGQIPLSFANLTFLESLDLSSNDLDGRIPQQLASLTYLEVLNLSKNHLVGTIPRGNQFDTFENTSYLGNVGLCGFPLSRICGANDVQMLHEKESKEFIHINGFTWQAVLIGYATGIVIGISTGCIVFITGKPKWFNKFVQQESSKLCKKKWPKEVRGL